MRGVFIWFVFYAVLKNIFLYGPALWFKVKAASAQKKPIRRLLQTITV